MSTRYVPISWKLNCPWCDWYAWVNPRGAHGNDPGAGVEAALIGQRHVELAHGRSWDEYLRETSNQDRTPDESDPASVPLDSPHSERVLRDIKAGVEFPASRPSE